MASYSDLVEQTRRLAEAVEALRGSVERAHGGTDTEPDPKEFADALQREMATTGAMFGGGPGLPGSALAAAAAAGDGAFRNPLFTLLATTVWAPEHVCPG